MKIIDQSVYKFSKNNNPFTDADPGELLLFKTMDCFSNRLKTEADLITDLAYSYDVANPAAGPVYINGAQPGDVLAVDILDVQVAGQGVISTSEGCGPLCEDMEIRTRVVKIKDQVAEFNGVRFPIDPMIGVIGTAPDGDDVIDGYPGNHGGNMDSKIIKKGARVYFPVRVEGALLQLGDVHATMGDAELCGTGIEIPAEVLVKVSLIKDFELHWPVTETATHWYVNACAHEFPEALKYASEELQRLLMNVTGWDKTDTYMYMSVQSDVAINQACVPCEVAMILRFGTPKLPQFKPLIG
ncbi:acetamidase/formamidase family protein [Ihubacter massiliensis]|uniref:Acetamidase/formamidase family protein n=1 Tax=Hominibacterium faecale TaxID=2839743 RepID=A0A9J6QXK8_9FIRM|nr:MULTISPECIES: acetamidase/formamidase family protein [Eubacteriales Family XIII. Incertae Sedis]MCI7300529.1 acetamidase/formamidase family protein [Clostridia bacterium]MDE8732229.1 acetamidase/formamidase family protein [Eubacteriales bacterium DFI.9.88]MDY3012512.1 acetamidase/formamidase family protein [Clostridiales Family XIII bacterium]MCO7122166.1 acetamidase/formamidase family protein [Ihubacter massiliensis]MCU7380176.1 acetamidase/formamidase family protein [Hominibacterium faeca